MSVLARQARGIAWAGMAALLLFAAAGCATPRIDWGSRVGNYTYDQAVLEFGPPDKAAKLADGTLVAEWLTRRGYTQLSAPFYGPYSWYYGPFYPGYFDTYTSPDYFLRLIFNKEGQLSDWKRFYR